MAGTLEGYWWPTCQRMNGLKGVLVYFVHRRYSRHKRSSAPVMSVWGEYGSSFDTLKVGGSPVLTAGLSLVDNSRDCANSVRALRGRVIISNGKKALVACFSALRKQKRDWNGNTLRNVHSPPTRKCNLWASIREDKLCSVPIFVDHYFL